MKKIVIAIDGHAGCGKSTTARLVAKKLNYIFIDSGAMYRAVTLYLLQKNISLNNHSAVIDSLEKINLSFEKNPVSKKNEILLNNENVESKIRSMDINNNVSEVSSIKEVRSFLVKQQHEMGKKKGIIMDGRDIGTVVFPDAELKIFMTASIEARAKRRIEELKNKGESFLEEEIYTNLRERDYKDSTRKESPLRKAADAITIDTSQLTIEEQVDKVIALVDRQLEKL